MNSRKKRIALVGNAAGTLIRFRIDLIKDLVDQGHIVHAFSPHFSKEDSEVVKQAGALPISYSGINRSGLNPIRELIVNIRLWLLFKKYKIDTVLSYFIKPSIYGSFAAKMAGVESIHSMIAGLGYTFTNNREELNDLRVRFLRSVLSGLFRIAFYFNDTVFFQNPDDLALFVRLGILPRYKAVRVYGSGIHLELYSQTEPVIKPVTFVTSGRLLADKGFVEFVEAARLLKSKYPTCRFILLGGTDDNPRSLSEEKVKDWVSEGLVEWPGKVKNVKKWLESSSVFVLASYYREGTPRSTLEAMSIGRAIITTNHPGCRETVIEGVNGYLVPIKNAPALAIAMEKFILKTDQILSMGCESRKLAEKYYDVKKVNDKMIENMGLKKLI